MRGVQKATIAKVVSLYRGVSILLVSLALIGVYSPHSARLHAPETALYTQQKAPDSIQSSADLAVLNSAQRPARSVLGDTSSNITTTVSNQEEATAMPKSSRECTSLQAMTISSKPSFTETFAGSALNEDVWTPATEDQPVYNNEAQIYTDRTENVRVEDGKLVLEARTEALAEANYTSGKVTTLGKKSFMYGRFDIRAKLPAGVGTWPAFWLLPAGEKYPGYDPAQDLSWLNNGEIDIMEWVGADPSYVHAALHSRNRYPKHNERTGSAKAGNVTGVMRTYSVEWTQQEIKFLLDGKVYYQEKNPCTDYKDWPYDQEFYLILNLAMGGTWGGMRANDYPPDGIDSSKSSWRLEVDSVTYYPAVLR